MLFPAYKLTAAIAILATSLLAVIYPLKVRAKPGHHTLLERADAFASGIFLGAALFHMLPDAITAFNHHLAHTAYPVAEAFCAAGFLILLFLERLSECCPDDHPNHSLPLMLAGILVIHALIEGAALGVSTSAATLSILFLAIVAHKGSESFALAVILNRSRLSLLTIVGIAGLFACMTPLGIGIGAILTENLAWKNGALLTAGFNAFAAGTFLYMSTLHHINHHHQRHNTENLSELWFLVAGLGVMAGLAFF